MNTAVKLTRPAHQLTIVESKSNLEAGVEQLMKQLGWSDLPMTIKAAIYNDVVDYYKELFEGKAADEITLERRKRVLFWLNQYRFNRCPQQVALEMLRAN